MYNVYLGTVLCPVAPEKITVKHGRNISVMCLADGRELVIPRGETAREIEFSLLLPNSVYPFAVYRSGFKRADYFLEKFREYLTGDRDIQLIVVKVKQDGGVLGMESVRCVIESLRVIDDAAQGTDVVVNIKLREHLNYFTKVIDSVGFGLSVGMRRSNENSPEPKSKSVKYRVVKGDCLWMIAQRFYGNGNLYPKIYDANKNVFNGRSPRCLIFVGDELEIPPIDG